MISLKELQDSFQKALLEGDTQILSEIPDTPREKHDVLLGVYQFAYSARLMEFLENDYPQLHAYLGDEQFETLCMAYIRENPSHHPNARWYGNDLPDFIAHNKAYSQQPQIRDLAALELALNMVFDEREDPSLDLSQLGQVAPDQWPALTFKPHKATKRLDYKTNVAELWNSLVSNQTPPDVQIFDDPLHLLVFREEFQSSFRSMSYEEAMMWDKMAAGVPFGVLCEVMATYGGEDDAPMRAGSYLHTWISAGLITDQQAA